DLQHVVVADEHVGGPKVAVDDALPMRVVDGVADLAGEIERAREIQVSMRRDDVLERLTRDVLHHDEEHAILLLGGRDRDDVGMADRGEQAGLSQEFAEVEALAVRTLDRDLLVDPRVLREVDRTEATAAERRDDLVLAELLTLEQQWDCE